MFATKLLVRQEKHNWFYRKTEPFFDGLNRLYAKGLNAFLKRRFWAIPFSVITLVVIGFLWNKIPAEMAPLEDRSKITINTKAAEGASYEYIRDYTEDINDLVDSLYSNGGCRKAIAGDKDENEGTFVCTTAIFFWRTAE